MSGLIAFTEPSPDFSFEGSGAMRRIAGDPSLSTATQMLNGSGGELLGQPMSQLLQTGVWMWNRCRRTENPDVHINHDDYFSKSWYGDFEDEPVEWDGISLDRTRAFDGAAAVGWAITAFGTPEEQRISYLSFTNDPDLAPPPEPGALQEMPQTVKPTRVSDLWSAGALRDKSPSGLIQTRSTKAAGWMFQMSYPLFNVRDLDHQELEAFLYRAWQRGLIFLAKHPMQPGSGLRPNGLGTANIQTTAILGLVGDESILTDGWPALTGDVVCAGDAIQIERDKGVYIVTQTVASDSGGIAEIFITPPLRIATLENLDVITTGIFFRVVISDRSQREPSRVPLSMQGPAITLLEALKP
jgi:hypothetical protein